MKQPFFKKEADTSNFKKLEDLRKAVEDKKLDIKKNQDKIMSHMNNIKDSEKDYKNLSEDKNFYNKELRKLNTYMDPNGLTLD